MNRYAIAIHGGAGTLPRTGMTPEKEIAYRQELQLGLQVGVSVLAQGGQALDAVEAAVVALEDCPLFNAGRGAALPGSSPFLPNCGVYAQWNLL